MRGTVYATLALVIWGCGGSTIEKGAEKTSPGIDGVAKPELGGAGGATSLKALGPVDLMDPSTAVLVAPDTFQVAVETTKGSFVIELHRDWAPNGVDRFYNLVEGGYYTEIAAFRAMRGFMVQFGISGDPMLNRIWKAARIEDDPTGVQSNTRGRLSFAMAGPNSRTSQVFINFGDNSNLDSMGFAPIGEVVDGGMATVDQLFTGYGEGAPRGRGPSQRLLQSEGNPYLKTQFPDLDYILKMQVVESSGGDAR